jgi:hypothetical protein
MVATAQYRNFKQLLDVNWPSIGDGQFLKRSGTNVIGIGTPTNLGIDKVVWISAKPQNTNPTPGTGTAEDPFDGGTAAKFDALMASFPSYTRIHLMGPGPFQTSCTRTWLIKTGWIIEGDGQFYTVVQLVGNAAGLRHLWVLGTDAHDELPQDNVIIRDLTCDANWALMSLTADNGAGGEKNIHVSGGRLVGTNNRFDRVQAINTYGSLANLQEQFAIALVAPASYASTGNSIRQCVAQLPNGTYGAPFAVFGSGSRKITARIEGCWAFGINNGGNGGFTTGGVNLADVLGVYMSGNTWIDCGAVAYHDTGTLDGLYIDNDVATRCGSGVNLNAASGTQQNVRLRNCNFEVQNRSAGAVAHVAVGSGPADRVTVSSCTFTNAAGGTGGGTFYPFFFGTNVTNGIVTNNIVDSSGASNITSGVKIKGNLTPAGGVPAGLTDN